MSMLQIRSGDFHANIILEELGTLGILRYRKLLKLMAGAMEENREARQQLAVFLPRRVGETTAALPAGARRAKAAHKTAIRQLEIFKQLFDMEDV